MEASAGAVCRRDLGCDCLLSKRAEPLRTSAQYEKQGLGTSPEACHFFCGSALRYFAAAWLFARARRSVFLRRTARFFTLSLPLQCPIGSRNTHAPRASAKQFRKESQGRALRGFRRRRSGFTVRAARIAWNHPLTSPCIPSILRSLFSQGKPPHTTEYAQPPCR